MTLTNAQKLEARRQLKDEVAQFIKDQIASGELDVTNAGKAHEETFSAIDARIKKLEDRGRTHDLPGSEDETHKGEKWSFSKVFSGLVEGNLEKYAPMEFAMSETLREQQYAQGTVPDSAGGFLVPMQVLYDQIVPILQPMLITEALGVNEMPISGYGIVEIPREVADPTTTNVAENQGSTSTDVQFDSMQMEPHTAQVYIESSRRFFSIGVGAEARIRRMMARSLAKKMNLWILKGTGADGEPIGVLNTGGINEVSFSGTVAGGRVLPTFYKKLLAMETAVAESDALEMAVSMGWAGAPRILQACRQIESDNNSAGTSNLEIERVVTRGDGAAPHRELMTYRILTTTQLSGGSSAEFILGDWDQCTLGSWNNLSIEASNTTESAMRKRQTHIVAYMDVDVMVEQPTAFCSATSLDLSSLAS